MSDRDLFTTDSEPDSDSSTERNTAAASCYIVDSNEVLQSSGSETQPPSPDQGDQPPYSSSETQPPCPDLGDQPPYSGSETQPPSPGAFLELAAPHTTSISVLARRTSIHLSSILRSCLVQYKIRDRYFCL
ncbi:hypothetical protein MAR_036517, partial [Mya arenaria]